MDVQLDASTVRTVLPAFLAGLATREVDALAGVVGGHVAGWSDPEIATAVEHVRTVGSEPRLWEANPLLRALARSYCEVLFPQAASTGVAHLVAALDAGPVLLLGNHLSYIDSLAVDRVLVNDGHTAVADRIVSVAGPKVYGQLFLKFASACLNTVPAPQSTTIGYTARLSSKEVARRALATMGAARGALRDGGAVLIFGEGSRTRTGRLGPFVRGVHRYLGLVPDLQVVPFAITGTDRVMPVGDDRLTPAPIGASFGAPLRVADHDGTRAALAAAWHAVAALLPPSYAPVDGQEPVA